MNLAGKVLGSSKHEIACGITEWKRIVLSEGVAKRYKDSARLAVRCKIDWWIFD